MTTPETTAGQAVRSTPLFAAYRDPRIFIRCDNTSENPAEFCELCHDTGYYGDNQPGIKGNREYHPCECNTMYRCRRVLARREMAVANNDSTTTNIH